jgi:uncharacterized protein (DUF1015 family)
MIASPQIQLDREPSLAEIHPFHGIYYNQSLVKDLAVVICPPYDIITPRIQQELYQRSECNFVRLEFGRELPQDKDTDNKYTRAAATLGNWLEQGVLEVGETPAVYLHDHHFTHQGKEYRRRSIICLVKLAEWSKMVVRPHEGTLSEPKGDRLSLLWALQANTSPILALFDDSRGKVTSLLTAQSQDEPMLNINTDSGEGHRLWAITDTEAIIQIRGRLARRPLYIADGHHRYESALAYQRERRAYSTSVSGEEPFDFVMMALVASSDPGLVILPAHRLVRGISKSALDGLIDRLKAFFEIEELPLNTSDIGQQVNELLAEEKGELKLVLYGLIKERLFVLKLHDFSAVSLMIPYFHSEIYKRLDVSIVDHVILEELLGLSHDMVGVSLDYSYDGLEAVNRILDQEYQLALMVSPVKPEVVKAVADRGDRMPRKSTYFYPKIPAGLVFYRLG